MGQKLPKTADFAAPTGNSALDQWLAALGEVFDVAATPDGFSGDCRTVAFGRLKLLKMSATAHQLSHTTRIAAGQADCLLALVLLNGNGSAFAAGHGFALHKGCLCILDLARSFTMQLDDFRALAVLVPRDRLEQVGELTYHALHGIILPPRSAEAKMLTGWLQQVSAFGPFANAVEGESIADMTCAIVEALALRIDPATDEARINPHGGNLLDQLRRRIIAGLGDPQLNADRLAQEFGMSRASLYRLFHPLGGVAGHIRDQRLSHARQDLADPRLAEQRLATIARKWGFPSEVYLARALKRQTGMGPREYREKALEMFRRPSPEEGPNKNDTGQ